MIYHNASITAVSYMMGASYAHPSLLYMLDTYKRIRDCLTNNVKKQKHVYLPDPSELREDEDIKNHRYQYYWERAQWLPVTKRTQQGLVAQVFTHAPTVGSVGIPQDFIDGASVNGDSLNGLANYATSEVVAMGRGAIVVMFTDKNRPLLDFVEAEHIVTWSELPYGVVDSLGRNVESITLRTFKLQSSADEISVELVVTLTQYKIDKAGKAWFRTSQQAGLAMSPSSWKPWQPIILNEKPLTYVPVFIIGSERNVLGVQQPPLEELAELNITHYIDSADYKEHAKVAGQVTTVLSGLEEKWYEKQIKGKLAFGVRAPIPLNTGAKASLLQANANSVSKESMDKTEQMMVAVGARLIEQRQIRRTATEADIEAQSYHSILGHIAANVSSAMTAALRLVAEYYGADPARMSYALNNDFSSISGSAEHRRLLLEEFLAGVISFSEYRDGLRRYSPIIGDDDDKARSEIEKDIDLRTKLATITTAAKTGGDNRTKQPTE